VKVYWSIEGVGCPFQQCGNKLRLLEIDDSEVEGMTDQQRQKHIDDVVEDEFNRTVFPTWEEKDEE
jgi:hypothetical protein